MNKIAILLCTYNSERFLREQIDSLIAQTYQDWELFIRDDQSTDQTLDIIQDYCQQNHRFHFMNDTKKRGARDGFMWLLKQVEAEYYMFCDHDDVWLPEKIEVTMKLMQSQSDNATSPLIACCNLKLVDSQLNVISDDYWTNRHYNNSQFNNKYYHLFYNNMPGCVMLINRQAKEASIPYPPDIIMHDAWIASAVLWRGGRVVWTSRPLMLYRQHGNNTIGTADRTLVQQFGIISKLLTKTKIQFHASRPLTNMSYLRFFILKLYYLLQYHWTVTISKSISL